VTELLIVEHGRLMLTRRVGASGDIGHVLTTHVGGASTQRAGLPIAVIAGPDQRENLAGQLRAVGFEPRAAAPNELQGDPFLVAARTAGLHRLRGDLASEAARRRATGRDRTIAKRLAAAALVCVVASGAIELWGQHRELDAVVRQRRTIKKEVAGLVEMRQHLTALQRRISRLDGLERTAPPWSRTLANVAEHLPVDAYLASLHARTDSLEMRGIAQRATGVFEALQQAPGMLSVRASERAGAARARSRTEANRTVCSRAADWVEYGT
jgi:Tfp pilus assembly protein PilN